MNRKLIDHLIKSGVCRTAVMQSAVSKQRTNGGDLVEILIEDGVKDAELAQALASFYNWKTVAPAQIRVSDEALQRVSGDFCKRHLVLPMYVDRNGELLVAVADPARASKGLRSLQSQISQKIRPFVAPRAAINRMIAKHYSPAAKGPSLSGPSFDNDALGGDDGFAKLGSLSTSGGISSFSDFFGEEEPEPRGNMNRGRSHSGADFGHGRNSRSGLEHGGGGRNRSGAEFSHGGGGRSAAELAYQAHGRSGMEQQQQHGGGHDPRMAGGGDGSEIERLREENVALRAHVHRIESSLQLEITMIRQILELLFDSGAIDKASYLEKMGKLR